MNISECYAQYVLSQAPLFCEPCGPRNNLTFSCSIEDYLYANMGPQQLPTRQAVTISVLYLLTFVTGVVGNAAVCIVILRHPTMRTATNYYLFSLACSDLLLLMFGLPNDLTIYWHQYPYLLGEVFCKLRAFISETSSYVSVLTIVAFSMERYLAICHPLYLYTMSGLQRAVRIIAALWLLSMAAAVPVTAFTYINYLEYPPLSQVNLAESAFCATLDIPGGFPVLELSSIVFFLLPALVMLVLYTRMGRQIRMRSGNQKTLGGVKGSIHGDSRLNRSRKNIVRMLATVVIAFFVCWAPFHAQRLLIIYGQDLTYFRDINEWLFNIAGWFYYVSATVNPILYNVMSNRYRVAFQETLCCHKRQTRSADATQFSDSPLVRTPTRSSFSHHHNHEISSNYQDSSLKPKGHGDSYLEKVSFHGCKIDECNENNSVNKQITVNCANECIKSNRNTDSDCGISKKDDNRNISIEIRVYAK